MSSKDQLDKFLHNLKNPLRGMLDALDHVEDMYVNDEDLTRICAILERTCQQVPQEWNKLNFFLNNKELDK